MIVGRVDAVDHEREPATVAGKVGEEAGVVARGTERGDMFATLAVTGIGGTLVHRRVGGEGLELVERTRLQVVELLEGDEGHLGELQTVVPVHAMGEVASREVIAQHGR